MPNAKPETFLTFFLECKVKKKELKLIFSAVIPIFFCSRNDATGIDLPASIVKELSED